MDEETERLKLNKRTKPKRTDRSRKEGEERGQKEGG